MPYLRLNECQHHLLGSNLSLERECKLFLGATLLARDANLVFLFPSMFLHVCDFVELLRVVSSNTVKTGEYFRVF